MIDEAELRELMRDESDLVEWTSSHKDADKLCKAVCAFSNDLPNHQKPGYILIGVNDKGSPCGLRISDDMQLDVAAIRSEGNIQPIPTMHLQLFHLDGGDVLVVEVHPSDVPPVRYKGVTYIRTGPRKAIATASDERVLSERHDAARRPFDAWPCRDASLEDLSLDLFIVSYLPAAISAEALRENNRSIEQRLAAMRLYDPKLECPTNAGILLFSLNPERWLPGAYVQYVKYDGKTLGDDILAERRFSGDLLTLLREVEAFLPSLGRRWPVVETALRERTVEEYPAQAVRELVMNAIMHRYYGSNQFIKVYQFSDRIEIHNPGGLYGEAQARNFPNRNDYRNPIITEAMKALGYANRFGRGVERAKKILQDNGSPEPHFDFEQPEYFSVTIWRRT